ncbi:MAG: nucleotidyltransferase family protein [Eubacteriales bacterium]
MKVIGIIAEYNPFHSGHRYHIEESRKQFPQEETAVVVVMSGHWVQQANCAITDKWQRSKMALEGGADLVIELPTLWAMSSAEHFARGAVALLEGLGCVDALSFGSELGDLSALHKGQRALTHKDFPLFLKEELKKPCSFPVARQQAIEKILGESCDFLSLPNNILGLSYLDALAYFKSTIVPMTVARKGSGFHEITGESQNIHTSATDIRAKLYEGSWNAASPYLNEVGRNLLKHSALPSLSFCERGIMSKIMMMTAEAWAKLPDSGTGEGLPHRLEKYGKEAKSVEEFLSLVKTKRYTHGRLRRLVLWAYLGLQEESQFPPFLRVLGMNGKGREVLQGRTNTLPICTKTAHIHNFSQECQKVFAHEVAATELYGLCFPEIPIRGREWREKPVLLF